jgi:aminobenzoyl-glutamate utilization protein A
MTTDTTALAAALSAERRVLHAHAESGFTEFWTASHVAKILQDAGWEVKIGKEIMNKDFMMGLPAPAVLAKCRDRALAEGADPSFVARMEGGFTAVAGIMSNAPGPVNGFRFDMDAVDVQESVDPEHFPAREGFVSVHDGAMHACGHDGHTSIGLALARMLAASKDAWKGTIKLVFQPAEEGVRGARSISESGFLDDVDNIVAGHLGILPDGADRFHCGVGGFLATSKLDFHFQGVSSHAGMSPEKGRSALLAAAATAVHLSGISRHGGGATRINVGRIEAGTGRNVVPEKGLLAIETRGADSELNAYMEEEAIRIAEGQAHAYGTSLKVERAGGALSSVSDPGLMELAAACATEAGYGRISHEALPLGGSEDFSYMMEKVREKGGRALYVVFGSDLSGPHHNGRFDFREEDLVKPVLTLFNLAGKLSGQ